ncbi:cytochrome P450 [Macroventuria anomochaeta]|uniref:Cytochrome P450 n=1 Tax=Macroventuria anomochaeta TaxID=301207 RepID=A0ACB6SEK8_9PLEO|nr:cytochrome P450 [Macroventuria anomochaeta]KAF2632035.1 cytochrome P450 [Macroventuria anomochaeta]
MNPLSNLVHFVRESPVGLETVFFVSVTVLFGLYKLLTHTDILYIRGIPKIPGALPVTGHLTQPGEDHTTVCEKWWRQYGRSVFQIRLVNTRAVILCTFHGLFSSIQGFTIGSSPWNESSRNKRKAASTTLSKAMMKNYDDMFDLESYCIVSDLHCDTESGALEASFRPYIQRYALNTTLTLCYGIRMDEAYVDLLREILHVGSAISLLRLASENYQDYIPILRHLPKNVKNARSKDLRKRRDNAAILKDEETRLTGVETIPGTLVSCIGSLCTPESVNDFEETIPYLNAIVKEAGRYYTVSNMSLPRKTMSDVRWGEAVIPKNTLVLISAQAGNHGTYYWGPDAGTFNPERWLDAPTTPPSLYAEKPISSTPHLSFGAGSRSCPGATIASKLFNAALFRLLSLYRDEASVSDPPSTDYIDYNLIKAR